MVCDEAQTIVKYLKDRCVICIAQSRRGLNERIERAMQIESRPADHLQNVGCGSLLFQGFGQLARSNLHPLEQTGILHRDQRLLCEGIDEGDLAFGEGAHALAEKHYHADYRLILQQRYAEPGSRDLAVTAGVVSREIRQDVGQVHRFAPAGRSRRNSLLACLLLPRHPTSSSAFRETLASSPAWPCRPAGLSPRHPTSAITRVVAGGRLVSPAGRRCVLPH